jgi:four helix bundle protein
MPILFDHEKLIACQRALEFVVWSTGPMERVPQKLAAYGQLDRASTSIPLNIAEGNGRFTPVDRCRFFDIARGSALECAATLDVLAAKKMLAKADIEQGKDILLEIVKLLIGLIRSNSETRLHEDAVPYIVEKLKED